YLCIYDTGHSNSEQADIIKLMSSMECPVAFCLASSKNVMGVLLLGNKTNSKMYSREEIQIFSTLANNVSIAMENSFMYESLIESKKQLEIMFDQNVQSEKMAAIGEMTSMLAHELKNPLGIIHSSAQYLSEGKQSKAVTQEMLHYIKNEVEHLNLSINSILKLAKQKAPKFAKINLSEKIPQLLDQWQRSGDHKSDITIDMDIAQPLPAMYADFRQLAQVLLNLIRNSEQTMKKGGLIIVEIRQDNDFILIKVADQGRGIPEDILSQVFNNFFTTKKDGLGLGLAACRQIINAHNGRISLKNRQESMGAVASIQLPIKPLASMGKLDKPYLKKAVITA
ncbi:ATP-binding protein, partial [Desulfobacterales bacterium HSG17]|nr:ATP-binding protein [Desulfobacterales bacterium HSG17]